MSDEEKGFWSTFCDNYMEYHRKEWEFDHDVLVTLYPEATKNHKCDIGICKDKSKD